MDPITALLVDSSPTFLRIAARFLRSHRDVILVETMQGSAEAVAGAQTLRPEVVLVDLAMPDPSGLTLIAQLRLTVAGTRIIALSLQDDAAYREAALAAGADAFVSKAALHTDLLPAIRRLGRSGQGHGTSAD